MRGGRENSIAPMLYRPQKKPTHTSSTIGWFFNSLKERDFVRVFGSWVKTRIKSLAFKELKNQPMAELVITSSAIGWFFSSLKARDFIRVLTHDPKTRTKSLSFKELKNQPMVELVWVGFFWGRYNIGAIEFSLPPLILDDFGALFHVIARKWSIPYWELNDFHDLADNNTPKAAT